MLTTKVRRIYKRNEVLHVCFNGMLIGPEDENESEITTEHLVSVQPKEVEGGMLFEVTVKGKGRRAVIKETWGVVNVPNDSRCA
jgi:hypothetical protein